MTEEAMKELEEAVERSNRFRLVNCPLIISAVKCADSIISETPELYHDVKAIHARMCAMYFEQLTALAEKQKLLKPKENKKGW